MKIAFIFFGLVKNYNETQHGRFVKNIQPALSDHEVGYFLSTSRKNNLNGTIGIPRHSDIESNDIEIDNFSMNNYFDFKSIIYDDLDKVSVDTDIQEQAQLLIDTYGSRAWGEHSLYSTYNSLKQIYSLNYFHNTMYDKLNSYDLFIMARTDLFYTHRLNLPNPLSHEMYVPSFGHWGPPPSHEGGCNDRFCVITSLSGLETYNTRYDSIAKNPEFFHSEQYLKTSLARNDVVYQELDNFQFRLLRANNMVTDLIGTSTDLELTEQFYQS